MSLLIHGGQALDRSLDPERMRRFHVGTSARRVAGTEGAEGDRFEAARGPEFSISHPVALATLSALSRVRPDLLPFDQLVTRVEADVGSRPGLETIVADIVLTSFFGGVVDLQLRRPRCAVEVPEAPETTALSRVQASLGPFVSNLRQQTIHMDDEVARALLSRLDGTRSAADLAASLRRDVAAGRLRLEKEGRPLSGPELHEATAEHVDASLRKMAEFGLLKRAER
jgi:hypothetical protein